MMGARAHWLPPKPESRMSEIKWSFVDCMLALGAILFLMTDAQENDEEKKQSVFKRLREKIAFARAQPLDIYLGARHQI